MRKAWALDMDRFSDALKKKEYRECIREDFRHSVENGFYGTPGLVLNDVRPPEPGIAIPCFNPSAAEPRHSVFVYTGAHKGQLTGKPA